MFRRLAHVLAVFLFFGMFAESPAQLITRSRTKRPNIVIFLADDLGYSDLGCYGGEIFTPNIDRLANGGLRMTHFYNCGRSCPSRAALLTGLWPHQTGVGHMMTDYRKPGYRGNLNKDCACIAEILQESGYQTFAAGVWHVTRFTAPAGPKHNWPLGRGFEKFYGTIAGAGSYFDPVTLCRGNQFLNRPEEGEYYYTDVVSDMAAQYVEQAAKSDKPFFLYVAYLAPHWPLHAPRHVVGRYRAKYAMGWDQMRNDRYKRLIAKRIISVNWPLTPRDSRVRPWVQNTYKTWQQHRMEVYAAQVDMMDRGVGRVMEKIKQVADERNTLVMFLSDNGASEEEVSPQWKGEVVPTRTHAGGGVSVGNNPNVIPGPENTYQSYGIAWANASNTPFRLYKRYVHEGGIATPFIAYWPGTITRPGQVDHQVAHVVDIVPTCLKIAKIRYPAVFKGYTLKPAAGKSLLPIFRGEKRQPYTLYWEHEGNKAMRDGKWKIVCKYPGSWELYDIVADRTEMKDLAPQFPIVVQELTENYEKWAKESNVEPWRK